MNHLPAPAPPSPTPLGRRRRILFVAEGVTLAHVGRPLALARGLDPRRFEVIFAVDPRHRNLLAEETFPVYPISSISSQAFLEALAQGRPLYSVETLKRYVQEELTLIREVQPDAVIGDFRLSLSISCALTQRLYLNLTNAYWSPYARLSPPIPEHILARALGPELGTFVFRLSRPLIYAWHALPMNRVRLAFGLPLLPWDLRYIYTHGDWTLYADVPDLVCLHDPPPNHRFLGPILWSPPLSAEGPAERWWARLGGDEPIIYVTLGSSGRAQLLPMVLEALADMPVKVLAATAGRCQIPNPPANALVAPFLPGLEAAQCSVLVICNGGSPTTHQALAAGKPVLALPSNLDQYLNMLGIQRLGAGRVIRSDQVHPVRVRRAVRQMLSEPSYTYAARRLGEIFATYQPAARLERILEQALNAGAAMRSEPLTPRPCDRTGSCGPLAPVTAHPQ